MSIALAGQRFALFKTLPFCPATRIILGIELILVQTADNDNNKV